MQIGKLTLDRPLVMGVLNVTPDSFSDGGRFLAPGDALEQAEALIKAGADMLDVGGESTRPGATEVSEQQELDRVMPVIEALRRDSDHPLSVDTSKAAVMREAVVAGADLINDIRALTAPGALEAAAELDVPVCLMHMRGQPGTMQQNPAYRDVTAAVCEFLAARRQCCVDAGITADRLLFDPGFGFGKTLAHNVALLANLRQVAELGQPVLVGLSRKSMLGELSGRAVTERVSAGIAAAVIAIQRGADIVRTHDVRETVDAISIVRAVMASGRP